MNIRDMLILSVLNFIPVKITIISQKVNFTDKYNHFACVPIVSSVTVY